MGHEVSAGVIVFRDQPRREYLVLDYGSHWDFPKGHIEPGEDPLATARRELREETAIDDARFVSGYMERMRYFYRKAGEQMRKTVIYFLAETAKENVILSHEHCGYAWVTHEEGMTRLTFKSARELLTRAHKFLEALPSPRNANQLADQSM